MTQSNQTRIVFALLASASQGFLARSQTVSPRNWQEEPLDFILDLGGDGLCETIQSFWDGPRGMVENRLKYLEGEEREEYSGVIKKLQR